MTSNEDRFQSIFQDVERNAHEENVAKFASKSKTSNVEQRNATSSRYTVQKSTDSKNVSFTPKQIAERRKGLSRTEARKAKIMAKYEKQLKKAEIKEQKRKIKLAKKEYKYQIQSDKKKQEQQSKQEADREKRIYKASKTIEHSVKKTIKAEDKKLAKEKQQQERLNKKINKGKGEKRLTPPKKRNFFVRFHNMRKYINDDFDYAVIEEDLEDYKNGKLSEEDIESEWEEIQEYEDARDDVKLRRGWTAFKLTLAGLALAGSLFACKTMVNDIQARAQANIAQEKIEMLEKRAESALLRLEDQQFFYEYTEGEPSLENWEKLPEEVQKSVRNPVVAAEAAAKNNKDQAHFYEMTEGDFSTEAWEKLPDELKQYIREPVSTAKEAFELGKDQMYLYNLSRGKITEEFWQTLPEDVRRYVRNPIELAKEFAEKGDASGYLDTLLIDDKRPDKERHTFWTFLPDELKKYVQDPNLVTAEQEFQTNTDDEIGER